MIFPSHGTICPPLLQYNWGENIIFTFLLCPLRTATTCSRSLLKTVAFLSAPPVRILDVSFANISTARIPDTALPNVNPRVLEKGSFVQIPATRKNPLNRKKMNCLNKTCTELDAGPTKNWDLYSIHSYENERDQQKLP